MIAYLFWHWPGEEPGYERLLLDFQARLAELAPPGLRASASYRVAGLPWLPAGAGYEDWYLVDGFAALGPLNEAIRDAAVAESHDAVAHASAGGAGALYALRSGRLDLGATRVTWVAKPRGTPYSDFYAKLPDVCLLRRQMVLGPAPEFLALGEVGGGLVAAREPVFESGMAGDPAPQPD